MKQIFKTIFPLVMLVSILVGGCIYPTYASSSTEVITPIHNYMFNSDNGSTVVDSVYSGAINGTANGTTLISENNDKYRRFNGSTDFISFNDPIIPIGEKSIKLRFRKDTIPPTDAWNMLLSTCTGDLNDGLLIAIAPTNYSHRGQIYFQAFKSGKEFSILSGDSVCDGQWHELLITWTGDTTENGIKLYLDDMTTPKKIATANFTESNIRKNLHIGKHAFANKFYFKGDIDKVEIYDKVIGEKTEQTEQTFLVTTTIPGTLSSWSDNYGMFFIAPYACEVVSIREAHSGMAIDSGSVTIDVEKLTDNQAPDSGVSVLNSLIDLKGAPNIVQQPELTSISNNLQLKEGDRLSLKDSGKLSGVSGVTLTIELKKID